MAAQGRSSMMRIVQELDRRLLTGSARSTSSIGGWDDVARSLDFEAWFNDEQDYEVKSRVVSKLLTFPMTTAKYLSGLEKDPSEKIVLGVLGARAEASLPVLYWNQLARITGLNWHLHFVGPQAMMMQGNEKYQGEERKELPVTFSVEQCYFHDRFQNLTESKKAEMLNDFDAFAFFNSGIGHSKEGLNWEPTLSVLQGSGKKALFTCFNLEDFDRDLHAMRRRKMEVDFIAHCNPLHARTPESRDATGTRVYFNYSAIAVTL